MDQEQTPLPNAAQQTEPNDEIETRIIKKTKSRGIIGLILGIIVLIGVLLPSIMFSGDSDSPTTGAIMALIYAPIYRLITHGAMIVCAVFLIITFVNIKKHKIKFSKYVIMMTVGFLLTFSPYVYSGAKKEIKNSDSFRATAVNAGIYDCDSSALRADSKVWTDANILGSSPKSVAEEIACSYLEYFYDNGVEPSSSAQLSQYFHTYDAKNGIATITINANQPDMANTYNIITHRSCDYDDTNNDSTISVWFRVKEKNNGLGCIDVTADEFQDNKKVYLNLYDLKQAKEWYDYQFEVAISKDEARELIENKRKASNDNTWTIGEVKLDSKGKEGYYWIVYEEIRDSGTKEVNVFFVRENGAWVIKPFDHNYYNNHHFRRMSFKN